MCGRHRTKKMGKNGKWKMKMEMGMGWGKNSIPIELRKFENCFGLASLFPALFSFLFPRDFIVRAAAGRLFIIKGVERWTKGKKTHIIHGRRILDLGQWNLIFSPAPFQPPATAVYK